MREAGLRYVRYGALLLGTTAVLLVAWRLGHALFQLAAGVIVLCLVFVSAARHLWRQTDPSSLSARGLSQDPVGMDPGLSRQLDIVSPASLARRRYGTRPIVPTPPPAPVMTRPASSGRTRRKHEVLSPDATLTLAAERQAASVDDVFAALEEAMVGLVPVKQKVQEIGSLLLVDRARHRFGLSGPRPNLHMCFTGAPGTGKTTVALMMAELLHRLGYLEKGHLVHAMRDDLVGQYIGQTAPRTKQVLERAMGGVLFIDEAYSLYRAEDSKDYGQECTDILMQVMENERDRLVVILAGYKDRMDHFFECNPGMSSRIAHHLDFAEYQVDELLAIGRLMLEQASYYMSPQAEMAFRDYMWLRMTQPRFANARSVRNELESARLRHAHRLAADPGRHLSKDDLMRLEPSDVVPSNNGQLGQPRLDKQIRT
jgi:probable Rubsico expression protein CbbX